MTSGKYVSKKCLTNKVCSFFMAPIKNKDVEEGKEDKKVKWGMVNLKGVVFNKEILLFYMDIFMSY